MNERIRELWSQAGGQYNSGNQHTWPEYTIDDPKKFAELIVKEMLQTCEDHPAWTGRMIGEQIKQHFGVEE
jgi:transposase